MSVKSKNSLLVQIIGYDSDPLPLPLTLKPICNSNSTVSSLKPNSSSSHPPPPSPASLPFYLFPPTSPYRPALLLPPPQELCITSDFIDGKDKR